MKKAWVSATVGSGLSDIEFSPWKEHCGVETLAKNDEKVNLKTKTRTFAHLSF